MTTPSIPVLIVGAGITGSYIAYLLALRGIRATLVAAGQSFPPASHQNVGGIKPLLGPGVPGPMVTFNLQAYRLHREHWPRIQSLSGIDFRPRRVARAMLAFDEAQVQALQAEQALYEQHEGFAARWLTPQELRALEPRLTDRMLGGLLAEGNAALDAEPFSRAVLKAAEALGARVIADEVSAISSRPDGVGVSLASGESLSADQLVLATGAWSELYAAFYPGPPPVRPVKGELLLVAADEPFPFDIISAQDGLYDAGGGRYWLGGTREERGFDTLPSAAGAEAIWQKIERLIPDASKRLRLLEQRAGLRPTTSDGLPMIGRLPGCEHILVATGSGAKGMLWSAGLAELCVKLLTDEADEQAAFSPRRFLAAGV